MKTASKVGIIIAVILVGIVALGGIGVALGNSNTTTYLSTSTTSNLSTTTFSTSFVLTSSTTSVSTSSSYSISTSFSTWSTSALTAGTANCVSVNALPDPSCTPGALNSNITQSTIGTTICVSGWTATVRPSTSYTDKLKVASIEDYHYSDTNVSNYEEDHFIPLELGGSPTSVLNLWAESHYGNYTSFNKDSLETHLKTQVCNGAMTLFQARQYIENNWVTAYQMYKAGQI